MSVLPFEETFDAVYGLDIVEVEPGRVRARIPVTNHVKQALGLVHGGVYAAAAESISTMGTYLAVHEDGNVAMGLSNATSFLRPITAGTVHVEARARHSGATTWMWDVDITDDDGRLCATTRVTVAVRPARAA
jgi:1,4-dihydroxy-2-naphthoyl-CoA hydrolase